MKNISKKIPIIQFKNQQYKQAGEATQTKEGTAKLLCETSYDQFLYKYHGAAFTQCQT